MSDEGLYISHAKRLYFGSHLIIDEWHPTQFYSPILLPFYAAYRFFSGSDDGVIRFFRIVAVLISSVSSILFFIETKKKFNGFISFCAAALLMVFSRANIAGASYYNLNLHFSVLSFIFVSKAIKRQGKKAMICSIASGVFISLAVLCQAFSAILFIGLIVCLLINKTTRKCGCGILGTVSLMGAVYTDTSAGYAFHGAKTSDGGTLTAGSYWTCPQCKTRNPMSKIECKECGQIR